MGEPEEPEEPEVAAGRRSIRSGTPGDSRVDRWTGRMTSVAGLPRGGRGRGGKWRCPGSGLGGKRRPSPDFPVLTHPRHAAQRCLVERWRGLI